jgi:hypothetical protein
MESKSTKCSSKRYGALGDMNNNRVYFLMKMYQSGVVVTTIPNGGTI